MASVYPENSEGIFSGKYLFTKLVAETPTRGGQAQLLIAETVVCNLATLPRFGIFE